MPIFDSFGDLNWIAVILAALSNFLVGFVWYHPKVLGTTWGNEVGLTVDDMNNADGMATTFGMTAIMSVLTAIVLGCIMIATDTSGMTQGLLLGLLLGIVIRGGAHVIHNGFAQRSMRLTMIDLAHDAVAIGLMGLILGIWI